MNRDSAPQLSVAADLLVQSQPGGTENRSVLNQAIHNVVGTVWHDEQSQVRNEFEGCASQFITAVPLFVAGSRGYIASGILSGLNQARLGDSTGHQLEDLSLGALKGVATKATFDHFGAKKWNFAAKGVTMGAFSRVVDVGLTRQTYDNGIGSGLQSTLLSGVHPVSLLTDVAVFGVAHYGLKLGKAIPAIEARPLLANALNGTMFGFTSGALGEVQRQWNDPSEHFDPLKVLARASASAATMTLAAGTGFKLTEAAGMQPVVRQPTTTELAAAESLSTKI